MPGVEINDQLSIPADDLQWSFSRSSGPGGQNVNKVNTKATLRWVPPDDFLPPSAWLRFKRSAKRYMTEDGSVVIQSQEHSHRQMNVQACCEKLRSLLVASLVSPKKRFATRPTKASRQRRLDNKRRQSDKKQSRNMID